jgi:curved DNA-binding protein CbpA
MIDCFVLLSEPRRPWLDPATLKQKFLARSAGSHPDKSHAAGATAAAAATQAFAELNAAYQCLAEPKSRLRHLLELELGAKPPDIQRIPDALADLFAEVAVACRGVDGFLAEKDRTTSPLLQVPLFERGQDWLDKLRALNGKMNALHGRLTGELMAVDAQWIATATVLRREILPALEDLYRRFGYFNRWHHQIQERMVRLSF